MRRITLILTLLAVVACSAEGGSTTTTGEVATSTTAATDPTTTAAPEPSTTVADAGFPVTVEAANGEVTIVESPTRIVSLAPTATEMLFAIGAGEQVVAVDDFSNYPEEAPITDLSGFEPNIEAIAGYEPDLVVVSFDPGELVSGLEAVGVPTLLLPTASSLDDSYAQLEVLGAATGHVGEAAEVVAQMQADIDEIVATTTDSCGSDLLSRGRCDLVLGVLEQLPRPDLRAARSDQHRRRGGHRRAPASHSWPPSTSSARTRTSSISPMSTLG